MTVYLDTAFAVNGSVNYLLLLSAAYLAGAPLRRGRFLLAAALGGLYAAASFVPALAFLRTAGMKAVLLAVMALTAFGARRQTVKLALLFAAISAALAGAAMLAAQLLRLDPLLLPSGVFYPLRARAILFLAALCCGLGAQTVGGDARRGRAPGNLAHLLRSRGTAQVLLGIKLNGLIGAGRVVVGGVRTFEGFGAGRDKVAVDLRGHNGDDRAHGGTNY